MCNDCIDNILIGLDIYKEKNKSENTCTNLDTCVSSVIKNLSCVKIDYQQLGEFEGSKNRTTESLSYRKDL